MSRSNPRGRLEPYDGWDRVPDRALETDRAIRRAALVAHSRRAPLSPERLAALCAFLVAARGRRERGTRS